MANEEGELELVVRPKTTGFAQDTRTKLEAIEAKLPAVEVQLAASLAKGFASRANEQVKAAIAKVRPTIEMGPGLAKGFATEARAQAEKAVARSAPVISFKPSIDSTEIKREVDRAERSGQAQRPILTVGANVDTQALAKQASQAIRSAAKMVPSLEVRFAVPPGARSDLLRDIESVLASAQRAVKPINVAFDIDPTKVTASAVEAVAAAQEAIVATPLDVAFDVDPTKLIAEAGAAIVAAEAALPTMNIRTTGVGGINNPVGAGTPGVGQAEKTGASAVSKIGTAAALGVGGVAVGVGAVGAGLLKLGSDFDSAFDTIQIQTGATGDRLEALKAIFKDTAAESRSSVADVATTLATLAQKTNADGAGLDTLTRQFTNLSRVTGTDLTTNLDAGITAFKNFQVPVQQYPQLLDELFRASQASGVAVSDLAGDLGSAGATLRTAGFDFSTSTALIANLRKEGIPAEQVIGSLGIAARKFAKDGKSPADGLKVTIAAIKNAKTSTEALTLAQSVFGRGAVGVSDAIRSGRFDFQGFADTVAKGTNTITDAATATDDFPELLAQIRNQLTVALEPVATPLFSSLSDAVGTLLDEVQKNGPAIAEAVSKIGPIIGSILKVIIGLIPKAIPLLSALGDVLGFIADNADTLAPIIGVLIAAFVGFKVVGVVTTIIEAVSAALGVLGSVIGVILSPVGAVIAAIAAIGAVFYVAYQQSQPFRDAIDAIGSLIMDTLWPAIQLVGQAIGALFSGDFSKAGDLIGQAGAKIGEFFSNIGPLLADAAVGLWDWLADTVPDLLSKAWDVWKSLQAWFWTTALPWLAGKLADGATALWAWLKDSAPKAIDGLREALDWVGNWLIDTGLPALGDAAVSGAEALWGWVVNSLPGLLGDLWDVIFAVGKWLITEAVPFIAKTAVQLLGALLGWVVDFAPKLIGLIWDAFQALGGWFVTTAIPWLAEKAVDLVGGILSGLGSLAGSLLSWIWDAFTSLVGALPGAAGAVLDFFIQLPFQLIAGLLQLGTMLVEGIAAAFVWLWNNLPGIAATVFDWFASLPGLLLGFLGDLGSTLWGWAKAGFEWLVENLPGIAQAVLDWFTSLPGTVIGAIGDLGSTLFDAGKDLMQGLWDGLLSIGGGALDLGKDIVNGIVGFINDHLIGSINSGIETIWEWLPGDPPKIPDIPKLAAGGIVTKPTVALIGEAGAELVLPLSDPARMAELLQQAGVGADAISAATVPTAAASIPLPDLAPAQAWANQLIAILAAIPAQLEPIVPLGFRQVLTDVLGEWDSLSNGWTESTLGAARVLLTTIDAIGNILVSAMTSIGERSAQGLADGLTAGTATVVAAVQGYATALTGALNPVLSAVGAPTVTLGFAEGGYIPGPRVDRDIVPALLMPGEVVVRRSSVDRFGVRNLLDLNAGRIPVGWDIPRFRDGGQVDPAGVTRGRALAERAVGDPYVWGAVGPDAYDCSGLWSAIISAVRDQAPSRLFTSSSLIDQASTLGLLPGLGQISVASFKGNPGHVAGTIGGVNYEATPPRVRKGAGARGADNPLFTNRFHIGSGMFLPNGQSITLPDVPGVPALGELSRTATALLTKARSAAQQFVDANTYTASATLGDLIEAGSGLSTTANVTGWLTEAIGLTGVPMSWLPYLQTGVQRESGGNPRAINLDDINARRGIPSKGLLQVIDPTFNRYKLDGHDDIWNPIDNTAAAIRYVLATYGDIANVDQFRADRTPKGYALGGLVTAADMDRMRTMLGTTTLDAPPSSSTSSTTDTDRVVAAIEALEKRVGPTFNLKTGAGTTDGQALSLVHRIAPLLSK